MTHVSCRRAADETKRKTKEDLERTCQARKLNTENAMDRSKWRKLIKDVR